MDRYKFKSINLIADYFDEHNIKYDVSVNEYSEQLITGFSVESGPSLFLRFITRDNDNDVAVRLYAIISGVPEKKRIRMMEACNYLNRIIRYFKFYIDNDNDINLEYDYPISVADETVGSIAMETFVRVMKALNDHYGVLMKALYSNEDFTVTDDSND